MFNNLEEMGCPNINNVYKEYSSFIKLCKSFFNMYFKKCIMSKEMVFK